MGARGKHSEDKGRAVSGDTEVLHELSSTELMFQEGSS